MNKLYQTSEFSGFLHLYNEFVIKSVKDTDNYVKSKNRDKYRY